MASLVFYTKEKISFVVITYQWIYWTKAQIRENSFPRPWKAAASGTSDKKKRAIPLRRVSCKVGLRFNPPCRVTRSAGAPSLHVNLTGSDTPKGHDTNNELVSNQAGKNREVTLYLLAPKITWIIVLVHTIQSEWPINQLKIIRLSSPGNTTTKWMEQDRPITTELTNQNTWKPPPLTQI